MIIRPATPADVPAVLPMVAAICALHESWDPERYGMLPDVVARYERWLPDRARDARSLFLVAADDPARTLAGFLVATIDANIPIYRRREYAFIHDVWIDPAHRRTGLARRLVADALERFTAKGITQVRLETAAMNDPARRLFASLGFRIGTIDMLREIGPGPGVRDG